MDGRVLEDVEVIVLQPTRPPCKDGFKVDGRVLEDVEVIVLQPTSHLGWPPEADRPKLQPGLFSL